MFRCIFLIFVLVANLSLYARKIVDNCYDTAFMSSSPMAYSGFSGGMMFNLGYGFSDEYNLYDSYGGDLGLFKLVGVPVGMGGAFKVNFGNYLRVGIEGYVSTMNFGGNGSYVRTGWGGVLVDSKYDINKWTFFVGLILGGGNQRHLNLLNDEHEEFQVIRASSRKIPFGAIAPFLGVEYALTKRVHLVMKLDYLFNVTTFRPDFVAGPKLFFGFMFCH